MSLMAFVLVDLWGGDSTYIYIYVHMYINLHDLQKSVIRACRFCNYTDPQRGLFSFCPTWEQLLHLGVPLHCTLTALYKFSRINVALHCSLFHI